MQHQFINRSGAAGELETFAMANCLMLLSSQNATVSSTTIDEGRSFSCKTCGRKFSSFQALGGHRASHKKLKPAFSGEFSGDAKSLSPPKPKTHACSICGVEFPIGQALGGHMRRHRPILHSGESTVTTEHSVENSDSHENDSEKKRKMIDVVTAVPILKKSSSSKRVCLDLDLSLNLSSWNDKCDLVFDDDHRGIGEGEIVEQELDDEKDFLKLELRQPINWSVSY